MASTRKAKLADQAFQETIGRVLGCISSDGLFVGPSRARSSLHPRVLGFINERSRLSVRGRGRLFLGFEHEYSVVEGPRGEYRVRTGLYIYTIFDADDQRVLGYHYHPSGRGADAVTAPHLHVYAPLTIAGKDLSKVHLRTGRVAIEDVVEFLITDLGVEPRPECRDSWQTILRQEQDRFTLARRWA